MRTRWPIHIGLWTQTILRLHGVGRAANLLVPFKRGSAWVDEHSVEPGGHEEAHQNQEDKHIGDGPRRREVWVLKDEWNECETNQCSLDPCYSLPCINGGVCIREVVTASSRGGHEVVTRKSRPHHEAITRFM